MIGRTIEQALAPGSTEINNFRVAATLNESLLPSWWGEVLLSQIFDPSVHGPQEDRLGNSMEDLRLSARGWSLARMVESGSIGSNKELANWIALNIAE
jgi:hypothetical protein